jgi:hypothetical protein
MNENGRCLSSINPAGSKLSRGCSRPISRAHIEFLTSRVEHLEKMLDQKEHAVPSTLESEQDEQMDVLDVDLEEWEDDTLHSHTEVLNSPPRTDTQQAQSGTINSEPLQPAPTSRPQISEHLQAPKGLQRRTSSESKRLVDHLLSTEGQWSYDRSSGHTRYYAPTTNIHVYSHLLLATPPADTWEQKRRTARVIDDFSPGTHDYLMELYWTSHNPVMHIVHKESFCRDKDNGNTQNYSGLLHICILAMGFRYADKTKPEIQKLTLCHGESTLHREAKYLFGYELDTPGVLARVQALLIMGDLECGLTRDNSGWMYTGGLRAKQTGTSHS